LVLIPDGRMADKRELFGTSKNLREIS